ncbi:hypothetical protein [Caulobacter sp. UNC279MFTsu5.1]|uniref:hypothetical protein n=1 Tax=Caulobacter sp. UNC279MFTsu5.1 TaxID=1502775 RepID=UPI0015A57F9D|nr:hypothetical protein [Caulobacter sp. UNC279MFTsu5.1]
MAEKQRSVICPRYDWDESISFGSVYHEQKDYRIIHVHFADDAVARKAEWDVDFHFSTLGLYGEIDQLSVRLNALPNDWSRLWQLRVTWLDGAKVRARSRVTKLAKRIAGEGR